MKTFFRVVGPLTVFLIGGLAAHYGSASHPFIFGMLSTLCLVGGFALAYFSADIRDSIGDLGWNRVAIDWSIGVVCLCLAIGGVWLVFATIAATFSH